MRQEECFFSDEVDQLPLMQQDYSDALMFMVVLKGSIRLQMTSQSIVLHRDDVFFAHVRDFHAFGTRSRSFRAAYVLIPLPFMNEVVHSISYHEQLWVQKLEYMVEHPILNFGSRNHALRRLVQPVLELYVYDASNPFRMQILHSFVQILVYEILHALDTLPIELPPTTLSSNHKRLLLWQFIQLMNTDRGQHRQVQWYADKLCVTPKYLTDITKQVAQQTPMTMIDQITLQEIIRLLMTTDLTIGQVAAKLNFANNSFFGKYVKRLTGLTPGQLRKQKMQKH